MSGAFPRRYTVCVDFDGVLMRYDSPWVAHDVIEDGPVDGALEWLRGISQHFDVVVFTTRAGTPPGVRAVRAWLREHGVGDCVMLVTDRKPPALVYVDDRAWRFDGTNFPSKDEVHRAVPWHKAKSS